jgi:hypothetical protein
MLATDKLAHLYLTNLYNQARNKYAVVFVLVNIVNISVIFVLVLATKKL